MSEEREHISFPTQTQETVEEVVTENPVTEDVVTEEAVTEETATEEQTVVDEGTGEATEETTEEGTEEEATEDDHQFSYDGEEINIEVPDDLRAQFEGSDLDIDVLSKELYEGDFGFSEETRAALDEKFGAFMVDAFLSSTKTLNDMHVDGMRTDRATAEADATKAWEAAVEVVGSEDNWNSMSDWATENLDDSAFEDFNAVMESGSAYAQDLAIKDMKSRYEAAEGTQTLELVAGETVAKDGSSTLTGDAFRELMLSGEYYKNEEKYDRMRRAAHAKGIE
jgi:hypothetical protein